MTIRQLHDTIDQRMVQRGRHGREKRSRPELAFIAPKLPGDAEAGGLDIVQIAVLAMEHLGRASLRAAFNGTEVCVAAPDEATAAIFRAALSETMRYRPTDRLIRVVVG